MSDENTNKSIFSSVDTTFKSDLIKETLRLQFKNPKTKINDDSVELMREIVKALTIETAVRSVKQAKFENRSTINLNDVEIVIPQIMLDFP